MEGTCGQGCPPVGEGAWGRLSFLAWSPCAPWALSPGLCLDAVTPGGAQEVGRHLPRVHMAQYELPWLGLSRSPGEDVPQGCGAWRQGLSLRCGGVTVVITRTPVQDAWARASLGRVGASAWSQDSCVKDGTSY